MTRRRERAGGAPAPDVWEAAAWRVRFDRQDTPGPEACLFAHGCGGILFEHGGARRTRAREVTLDGRAPRRSDTLGGALRAVVPCGDRFAVLMDGRIGVFNPTTFTLEADADVAPLTSELCASPRGTHVYAGHDGLVTSCQVVDLAGSARAYPGVAPPIFALPVPDAPEHEIWLRRGRAQTRVVGVDGLDVRQVGTIEAPDAARVEAVHLADGRAFALVGAGAPSPAFPYPTPADAPRLLAHLRVARRGIVVEASASSARIDELLGVDAGGYLVGIGYAGKPYVARFAADTLAPVGRRAFRQSGDYRLAALVEPARVLALRRYDKLDRACVTRWDGGTLTAPRVADADVTGEA